MAIAISCHPDMVPLLEEAFLLRFVPNFDLFPGDLSQLRGFRTEDGSGGPYDGIVFENFPGEVNGRSIWFLIRPLELLL